MEKFYKKLFKNVSSVAISVAVCSLLMIGVALASTTISTNISTEGTLSVTDTSAFTGASTFTGLATFDHATSTSASTTDYLYIGPDFTEDSNMDFTAGDLFVANDANIVGVTYLEGALQATSTSLFTGAATFYGDVTLGDAVTDTVTIVGPVDMGTMDVGLPLTTTDQFAIEVHTEPAVAMVAGDTGLSAGIRSRYHVTVDQTNQVSISAIEGRLRVKAAMDDGVQSAISGTIEASTSGAVFTGPSTTQRNAGTFALDFGSAVTLTEAGWLTGVTIDSSVHGDVSMANTEFAGLRIKTSTDKEPWEYGIHLRGSTVGIDIGAATTGIAISGAGTNALVITQTGSTATDGYAIKLGTSGTPLTTATADASAVKIYSTNSSATGDNRGIYNRFFLTGDGAGGGESLRSSTVVNANVGTAHGAHFGIEFEATAGGSETSGLGVGLRGTLMIPNIASWAPTGTYAAGMFEIYSEGTLSDPAGMTELSVLRLLNGGDGTGGDDVDTDAFLFSIQGFTAAAGVTNVISSTPLAEIAPTNIGIRVKVGTNTYYIPAVLAAEWN